MADENIISVSSVAAESDPGNAENFLLLGILPVSLPYLIFPYYSPGFPSILRVSLPYPCFSTILPVSLEYPTIPPVYYPTISTICFPCDFNEMETLHTPMIRAQSDSSCMEVQFSLVGETHAQPSDKVV